MQMDAVVLSPHLFDLSDANLAGFTGSGQLNTCAWLQISQRPAR